jgi:hypothetical protein
LGTAVSTVQMNAKGGAYAGAAPAVHVVAAAARSTAAARLLDVAAIELATACGAPAAALALSLSLPDGVSTAVTGGERASASASTSAAAHSSARAAADGMPRHTTVGSSGVGHGPRVGASTVLSTALAEATYAATLRALPACAREWFAALPERHRAAAIECYSTAVVSPGLVQSGLAAAGAGT